MKRIYQICFIFAFALCIGPGYAKEQDVSRPAITIINPVRGPGLGHDTDDLPASLKAQWQETREAGLHGTWLFQYGALADERMTDFAKGQMQGEEFGLLFEIDRDFAQKSGVTFRGQGAWYASDGLFLNSYDRSERRKLIDTAFAKFKEVFGYYPKTVGAWWIGGDSLTYMQETYGITAAMRASDQFNLDFYSVWGTPWDIPYLPSKRNEGLPADSFDESAKVVILQWALRDPVRGYEDPLYSLQDYTIKDYTPDYVDYIASVFLQKPFGNMVIGVENGGTKETFGQYYKTILSKAKEFQASGQADIQLVRDYAKRYLAQQKVFATKTYFLSTGYESQDQSFWYISENYRALILKTGDTVSLADLRNYADKIGEDFDILPNSQSHLRINEPAIIDSQRFPGTSLFIKTTNAPLVVKERGDTVALFTEDEKIASFTPVGFTVNGGKTFTFTRLTQTVSPLQILIALYVIYFGIILLYKKNIRRILRECLLLLVPLAFALPFVIHSPTFLYDKKETIVLAAVSLFRLPVFVTAYISKLLPFAVLFMLHYLFILRGTGKNTRMFWGYYVLTVFLYLHVPYFPLDTTTYPAVIATFAGIALVLLIAAIRLCLRFPSRRLVVLCVIAIPAILLMGVLTVILSRSMYALTQFEIQALQDIKNQKKEVVYVEEVDYSVRPIYREIRPLLYANYRLGQLMSATRWETVMRPESNVLKLSGYENKLIVIPRYLGSDISDYEVASLDLIKIFDNAQIALFEKQ